jgi:hypothetical protein
VLIRHSPSARCNIAVIDICRFLDIFNKKHFLLLEQFLYAEEPRLIGPICQEFLNVENTAPIEIHQRLGNLYGNMTVNVSTVRR